MWLRRDLAFLRRLARYQASQSAILRALDTPEAKLRIAQYTLLAIILIGGYLVGRLSAPGCAPLVSTVCVEAKPVATPLPAAIAIPQPAAVATLGLQPPAAPASLPSADLYVPATMVVVPPRPEKTTPVAPLSNDEIREMQAWLKVFGFDPGPIDGYAGQLTTAAVKRYQAARQVDQTGLLDRSLLRMVRKQAGHS